MVELFKSSLVFGRFAGKVRFVHVSNIHGAIMRHAVRIYAMVVVLLMTVPVFMSVLGLIRVDQVVLTYLLVHSISMFLEKIMSWQSVSGGF